MAPKKSQTSQKQKKKKTQGRKKKGKKEDNKPPWSALKSALDLVEETCDLPLSVTYGYWCDASRSE